MRNHKTRVCLQRGKLKPWITVVTSESVETGDALSSLLFVLSVDGVIRKGCESSQVGTEECRLFVTLICWTKKVRQTLKNIYKLIKIIYLYV